MKRTILTLLAAAVMTLSASAQNWKMVITKSDGTTMELPTADIDNITYVETAPETLPDQNVDQVIIKEIYNGGCLTDDGAKYQFDKCIILYNNCTTRTTTSRAT